METNQIEKYLETDSDDSLSSNSDHEVEISLKKQRRSKRKQSKKVSNHKECENVRHAYDQRTGTTVDNNTRSNISASEVGVSELKSKKSYGTPTRKRKLQTTDDCEMKQDRNGCRSPRIKMKLKTDSQSGIGHWKVSKSNKKLTPKSKEEIVSKSTRTPDKGCSNIFKTPTKHSAKKNLFSPERSPEYTNHQLPVSLINTPNKEQKTINNQLTPLKNKSSYNSTPKKDINSDYTSNAYGLRNKTPIKVNKNDKYVDNVLLEHGDENEIITALTSIDDDLSGTPQKITRRSSKQIAVNDKYNGLFLEKARTPLKEIESSPSKVKCSSDLKTLIENSPFKTVNKDLNVSTPTTKKRLGQTTTPSLHDKLCKNIENEEIRVSNTMTPGKEANSPNVKQEHSSYKRTPRKRLPLESSPYRQNPSLPSSPESMKCGIKRNAIVKLDRINTNLSPRHTLKTITESSNERLNSPEIVNGESKKSTPQKRQNEEETKPMSPSKHVQLKRCASPLKKREITVTTPVSKKKEGRGFLTPSMAKRTHETNDKGDDALDMTRKQLHISTVPKSLPCRDAEFSQIKSFLLRKIEHSAGGCMYISGVPGTGKTATVHAVIRALQQNVKEGDLSEFDFVEVNGLRLTEPRQAYVRIYQALTNQKLTPDQAQQLLNKRFSGSCKRSTIILVDELDYLCNRRQDVVYNILDWPSKRSSALVVLTISNTMDLPERTLKGRVTSRMGLTRLTFQPYTHHQLKEIVEDRLIGSATFHPDAIQLVARKVAAVSGDARRALDICRRTTELVHGCGEQITVTHVEEALLQLCASARVQVIKSLSGLGQLVLRSVRDVCQRTGVDETTAASVYKHLRQLTILEGGEVPRTGALLQTCVTLVGLGLLVAEKGRVDLTRKMSLNVSSDDIHYALDNIKA